MRRPVIIAAILFAVGTGTVNAQPKLLGKIDFPTSGSAEAQPDFIEGVLFLHNFEYRDAADSFRRAQSKDSSFGLAYWGEAMTHNHPVWMDQDTEDAQAVLKKLGESVESRSAFFPTERERDLQLALETLYGNTPESEGKTKEERDDLYLDAMRSLHEKYPTDDEITSFYALSILGSAHEGRDFATYMKAAAVAFKVWEKNQLHPGAAHYLIHSFDDPVHAPLGLPMAEAYSRIAPSAAHAQHMTSHIFVALGMWDETVEANEVARDVVNAARAERGRQPSVCGHYTFWLMYGYLMQERLDDGKAGLDACAERVAGGDPTQGEEAYFASMRARYIIDTQSWNLADEYTTDIEAGQWGARDYEFLSAFAAASMGDEPRARMHLEVMFEKADEDDMEAPILEKQVNAILAVGSGNQEDALVLLREAAELEASLPFEFGPPSPVMPAHELLGSTLMTLGRFDEARDALLAQLKRTPGRTTTIRLLEKAEESLAQSTVE
jgi:hypothetical protein